ncbi:Unknown protein [Striga hermonthica]|uniref:Uncharacterized protein n=1 Tax=Striga hermonthica TaxID=68872 RepID=A0A9N7RIC1_STRHE|nr:Unknown protein [Striga hermonthica]
MSTPPRGEDSQKENGSEKEGMPVPIGLGAKIEGQYRKMKEHAETYPYVWGSYILVYGGLGLWLTYRWRKLRKTEDRVRVLQDRLRKLVEVEQPPPKSATKPASLPDKATSSADKS